MNGALQGIGYQHVMRLSQNGFIFCIDVRKMAFFMFFNVLYFNGLYLSTLTELLLFSYVASMSCLRLRRGTERSLGENEGKVRRMLEGGQSGVKVGCEMLLESL